MDQARSREIGFASRRQVASATFLIANTLAGSVFGLLFWIVAARSYTQEQVGLGAAYISALTLLVGMAELGLGNVLIRFAPSIGSKRAPFINAALVVVMASTAAASMIFALGTPLWSHQMSELAHSLLALAIFVSSAATFGLAQVVDKVFVAFERVHFLFARNMVANIVRIAIILAAAHVLGANGLVIAIGGGATASLILSSVAFVPRTVPGYRGRPTFAWALLRARAGYSLGNHFANLLWAVPALIYPVIVVSLLGPRENAQFYMSWMIANLLFIVPTAVFTSAFARAANVGYLEERLFWRTMQYTLIGLLLPALALSFAAPLVLHVFGNSYEARGSGLFILLVLSVFPYTVSTAVITFHRIERNLGRMVAVSSLVTLLCLSGSTVLGARYSLPGIGFGWLGGQLLGAAAALLSRTRAARPAASAPLNESAPESQMQLNRASSSS